MPSTFLTSSGYEKLQGELDYLRRVKRSEIAELLRDHSGWDNSDGDSEPDFDITKQQQAFLEGRIQELETLLSNPLIIDHQQPGYMVEIGSKVSISENGGDSVRYTIVGPVEAAPVRGLISFASPLGSALMGHSAGDEVIVKAPGGVYPVSILEVS